MSTARCGLLTIAGALVLLPSMPLGAASAVAYDPETGAYAYRFGFASAAEAEKAALDSCRVHRGVACEVIASCDAGGFGMIYTRRRRAGGVLAIGASCGAASSAQANDFAKAKCNEQLQRRAGACGGVLGRCRCGGPRHNWRD